jgi:hypothetical protein
VARGGRQSRRGSPAPGGGQTPRGPKTSAGRSGRSGRSVGTSRVGAVPPHHRLHPRTGLRLTRQAGELVDDCVGFVCLFVCLFARSLVESTSGVLRPTLRSTGGDDPGGPAGVLRQASTLRLRALRRPSVGLPAGLPGPRAGGLRSIPSSGPIGVPGWPSGPGSLGASGQSSSPGLWGGFRAALRSRPSERPPAALRSITSGRARSATLRGRSSGGLSGRSRPRRWGSAQTSQLRWRVSWASRGPAAPAQGRACRAGATLGCL